MRVLPVLLFVAATLAGCAGQEPVEAQPEEFESLELEATSDTGIIRGVVVDTAIVPLMDAVVRIESLGIETTSNDQGLFGFQDLEPGIYFLDVSKENHFSVQQSVEVVAGVETPDAVRIILELDVESLPYFASLKWDGHMMCGLSVIALCGVVDIVYDTPDEFITELTVDEGGVDYLQSEMVWKTTTSVSPNMALWQQTTNKPEMSGETCAFEEHMSGSPLIITTTWDKYGDFGDEECFIALGNETDLQLRVFSGSIDGTRPPTDNGCYPVINLCTGVGATLEQPFEVFNHIFYGYTPPEGWTFGADGEYYPGE